MYNNLYQYFYLEVICDKNKLFNAPINYKQALFDIAPFFLDQPTG